MANRDPKSPAEEKARATRIAEVQFWTGVVVVCAAVGWNSPVAGVAVFGFTIAAVAALALWRI